MAHKIFGLCHKLKILSHRQFLSAYCVTKVRIMSQVRIVSLQLKILRMEKNEGE